MEFWNVYLFAIIIFVVVYGLITNPGYSFVVRNCYTDLYAKYAIALTVACIAFIGFSI